MLTPRVQVEGSLVRIPGAHFFFFDFFFWLNDTMYPYLLVSKFIIKNFLELHV